MPLTFVPPANFTFTAQVCRESPSDGRFAGANFFGAAMFEIVNTGTTIASSVEVTVTSATRPDLFELNLYGPTKNISIPPGGRVPIGIAFARRTGLSDLSNRSGTITVSWREPGSGRQRRGTTTLDVTVTLASMAISTNDARFVPSEVELIAGSQDKNVQCDLRFQKNATSFTVAPLPFPPTSAFSAVALGPTVGQVVAGQTRRLTLGFRASPMLDRTPRVVTVTVGTQTVPFICWAADTPEPGELAITAFNADPPGADLANETVTITNVSGRTLSLGGCRLSDEGDGASRQSFTFPPRFSLNPGASVMVHTGSGSNSPTDLFWRLRSPVWNNDFDTAILTNLAGEEIARQFYRIPNTPTRLRITNQTLIFDVPVAVSKAFRTTSTGITLEDGDFVIFNPVPTSSIWTDNLLRGATGPEGIATVAPGPPPPGPPVPDTFPLPGAPMYSLLAEAGLGSLFLGNIATTTVLVKRRSIFLSGSPLSLLINDDAPGGTVGTFGAFICRVRVFRR